jgi:hypothetical protein
VGEFDDIDPSVVARSVDQQREMLRRGRDEAATKAREEAAQRAAQETASLKEADDRTAELFDFLRKAFSGHKMRIKQDLVVERTGSRPERIEQSRVDEKPPWVVIRAGGTSTNPRHRPASHFNPEYVLAARCGVNTKYELLIYPILQQDRSYDFATNDRDEFLKRVQDEIAGR